MRLRFLVRGVALGCSAALTCGAIAFVIAASCIGPIASPFARAVGWAVIALVATSAFGAALLPLRRLSRSATTQLFHATAPTLLSPLRSAIEFGDRESDLVSAHREDVLARLQKIPPARVVPFQPRIVALVVLATLLSALVITQLIGRVRAGSFSLMNAPAAEPQADLVSDLRVHVTFPSYLDREPTTFDNPTRLTLPAGATLLFTVTPRVPVDEGAVLIAGSEHLLTKRRDALVGSAVARETGSLEIRLTTARGPMTDRTRRTLEVEDDAAPQVDLVTPSEDLVVELFEIIPLSFDVRDDHGVMSTHLIVSLGSGTERERPIADYPEPLKELTGETRVRASELGAEPGDRVLLTVIARDANRAEGAPQAGRSETRVVTIASAATRRERELGALAQILDRSLASLADRLETPVPADPGEPTEARFASMTASLTRLEEVLDPYLDEGTPDTKVAHHARALRRARHAEARLHARAAPPIGPRRDVDSRLVGVHEDLSLALHDALGAARIDDAAAIARELESLRREMTSLLAELRRTDSAEAREALMRAIARAERRLGELAGRLAAMKTDVPSEFLNPQDLESTLQPDAVNELREALLRGDLDEASRQLDELERRIGRLSRAFDQADEGFSGARFGPRERAMADAMERLTGIESEQRLLSQRSEERRRNAARSALAEVDDLSDAAGALRRDAERAQRAVAAIPRAPLGPYDREALDNARQRLRDVIDSLKSGDLGEANAMAQRAQQDVEALARDLELSALMFPGHDGRTRVAAQQARDASRGMTALRDAVSRAIPELDAHLDVSARAEATNDQTRQAEVDEASQALEEAFAASPDDAPLYPEGAEAMGEARQRMEAAKQALRRGDAVGASTEQQEAARRLTELREELERQQQQQQQDQSGGGGGGSGERSAEGERVLIPGQSEPQNELRRRVLDAMRDASPRGYEDAVRRYYDELLR